MFLIGFGYTFRLISIFSLISDSDTRQSLLFEEDSEVLHKSLNLWHTLVGFAHQHHPDIFRCAASENLFEGMIALSVAGPNENLDSQYLLDSHKDVDTVRSSVCNVYLRSDIS